MNEYINAQMNEQEVVLHIKWRKLEMEIDRDLKIYSVQ